MMGYLEGAFDALNDVLKKSVPPNVYRSWTSGARALGELSPGAAIRDVKEESAAMVDAAREGRWLDAGAGPAKMAVAMAGIVPPIRAARIASKTAAPIRGYHGSPHDFAAERLVKLPDGRTEYIVGTPGTLPIVPPRATVIQDFPLGRFRADKVGTGEGAQVYGHGAAYIAENEGVARGYRERLSAATGASDRDVAARILEAAGGDYGKAAAEATRRYEDALQRGVKDQAFYDRMLAAKRMFINREPLAGRMYEVGIHADPAKFLDWDKPLSQQSAAVQKVVRDVAASAPASGKGPSIRNREAILAGDGSVPGDVLYSNIGGFRRPAETSAILRDAGIPGIKYLDQGSRTAGTGSSNYVPFDESIIEILRKYGLLPVAAGGAAAATVPGLLSPTQEY